MCKQRNQAGYSLIEVLIALTILMIAIVAPITIAIKSLESSTYSLEQNTAVFLAQESISMVEALRNQHALENLNALQFTDVDAYWDDWITELSPCLAIDGCGFDSQAPTTFIDDPDNIISCDPDGENCRLFYSDAWGMPAYRVIDTGAGEESVFIRRFFLDSWTPDELVIRVIVEWESDFLGQTQQVSLSSALYNVYGSSFVE